MYQTKLVKQVRICHYEVRGKVIKRFGNPCLIHINELDKASDAIQHVAEWLGITSEECANWALSIVQGGAAPKVLHDISGETTVLGALDLAGAFNESSEHFKVLNLGLRHHDQGSSQSTGITIRCTVSANATSS